MSDYSSTYTESTGDTIDTTDFSTEFNAIETAVATKFDKGSNFGSDYAGGAVTADSVSTAPGTATVDFTGLPAWVKRVVVIFDKLGMSSNTGVLELQLGTSGGIDTTADYEWSYSNCTNSVAPVVSDNATFNRFRLVPVHGSVTDTWTGHVVIENITGNTWVVSSAIGNIARQGVSNGRKALGGALTQLRVLNSGGHTFDTGSINIFYEG